MTPEGKVKEEVKNILKDYMGLWFYMPVSNGMGVHGIPDFIGCDRGRFFAVETKADKGKMTALQERQRRLIEKANGKYFLLCGVSQVYELRTWLKEGV